MLAKWASKRLLDPSAPRTQPWAVRTGLASLALLALPAAASAQAPQAVDLWRVATASLAVPAALQRGPSQLFWHPAASPASSSVGLQLLNTSDVVGMTGVMLGGAVAVSGTTRLGATAARVSVGDLVRTTSSPNSEGEIPVYAQHVGLHASLILPRVSIGGHLRIHDARFDREREGGTTVDVGFVAHPWHRLQIAAATQFFPIDLTSQDATEYYFGVAYRMGPALRDGGAVVQVLLRYGGTVRASGDLDHMISTGLAVGRLVRVDGSLARESAFAGHEWRPALGLTLSVGRYRVTVARSSGLRDVGATYRLGLEVGLTR